MRMNQQHPVQAFVLAIGVLVVDVDGDKPAIRVCVADQLLEQLVTSCQVAHLWFGTTSVMFPPSRFHGTEHRRCLLGHQSRFHRATFRPPITPRGIVSLTRWLSSGIT